MPRGNVTNPYYFEDPYIAGCPLRVCAVCTVIATGISTYFVVNFSQQMSRTFRYMLLYHLYSAAFFTLLLTVLCFPRLQLPYISFKPIGLLTYFGVPSIIQAELILALLQEQYSAVIVCVYYRMDVLLPTGHCLNKKSLRYFIYSFTYVGLPFIAFLSVYLTYQDQKTVKNKLFEEFHMTIPDIFVPEAYAVAYNSTNIGMKLASIYCIFNIVYLISLVLISSTNIYIILRNHTRQMSKATKNNHVSVIRALAATVVTFLFLYGIVTIPLTYLCLTQSWRVDLWDLCILNGTFALPMITSVFGLTYKPHRNVILGLVRKSQQKVQEIVSTASTQATR